MRQNMPIDESVKLAQKVRQLADSFRWEYVQRHAHINIFSFSERCTVNTTPGCFTIKHPDFTIEIGATDENVSLSFLDFSKLKKRSQITGCKVGYFGQPLFDAPEALALMKAKKFTEFRDAISEMIATIPKDISQYVSFEKSLNNNCKIRKRQNQSKYWKYVVNA